MPVPLSVRIVNMGSAYIISLKARGDFNGKPFLVSSAKHVGFSGTLDRF
uniref:Uncharacterized protein n=1 Tax=Arundo donax TaxID=35708 RepID=A0A0A9ERZ0_ARUDO